MSEGRKSGARVERLGFGRGQGAGDWSFEVVAGVLLALVLLPAGWPILGAVTDGLAWSSLVREAGRLGRLFEMTAVVGLGTLLLALPMGVAAGVLLSREWLPGRRAAWVWMLTTAVTPTVLYAGGWRAGVGPYGFVRPEPSSVWFIGWPSVVIVHALAALPWVAGIVALGLMLVDQELEEQAALDASASTVLARISLPLARPAVALAAIVALVPVLGDMSASDLYRVRTFAEEIYTELEEGTLAPENLVGAASSGGRVTILATLPWCALLAAAAVLALGRLGDVDHLARSFEVRGKSLGVPRTLVGIAVATAFCHALPFAGLIRQLGLETIDAGGRTTEQWSPAVAGAYLRSALTEPAIAWSLLHAGVWASVAVAAALVLAWKWRWAGPLGRSIGLALALWLLVLPGPILATTLIELSNARVVPTWFFDQGGAMVYAQVCRAIPYAWLVLTAGLCRLDRGLLEIPILEGAGAWTILLRLVVPSSWPIVGLALVIASAVILTELPATKLLYPPGADPLSVQIFSLLHTGTGNAQAALCLVLLLATGLLAAAAAYFASS